jgi:hypothetical protein
LSEIKPIAPPPAKAVSIEWEEALKAQGNEKFNALKKNFTVRFDPKRKLTIQGSKGITAQELGKAITIAGELAPLVFSLQLRFGGVVQFRSAGLTSLNGLHEIKVLKELKELEIDIL